MMLLLQIKPNDSAQAGLNETMQSPSVWLKKEEIWKYLWKSASKTSKRAMSLKTSSTARWKS
jgi:hypothetical protein